MSRKKKTQRATEPQLAADEASDEAMIETILKWKYPKFRRVAQESRMLEWRFFGSDSAEFTDEFLRATTLGLSQNPRILMAALRDSFGITALAQNIATPSQRMADIASQTYLEIFIGNEDTDPAYVCRILARFLNYLWLSRTAFSFLPREHEMIANNRAQDGIVILSDYDASTDSHAISFGTLLAQMIDEYAVTDEPDFVRLRQDFRIYKELKNPSPQQFLMTFSGARVLSLEKQLQRGVVLRVQPNNSVETDLYLLADGRVDGTVILPTTESYLPQQAMDTTALASEGVLPRRYCSVHEETDGKRLIYQTEEVEYDFGPHIVSVIDEFSGATEPRRKIGFGDYEWFASVRLERLEGQIGEMISGVVVNNVLEKNIEFVVKNEPNVLFIDYAVVRLPEEEPARGTSSSPRLAFVVLSIRYSNNGQSITNTLQVIWIDKNLEISNPVQIVFEVNSTGGLLVTPLTTMSVVAGSRAIAVEFDVYAMRFPYGSTAPRGTIRSPGFVFVPDADLYQFVPPRGTDEE